MRHACRLFLHKLAYIICLAFAFSLVSGCALADTLQMSGVGQSNCGFNALVGYESENDISFRASDSSGNTLTGVLQLSNYFATCTPGIQTSAIYPIGGSYTYLGESYSFNQFLNTSATFQNGAVDLTLGYQDPQEIDYLNLTGNLVISSLSFGQEPVYYGGTGGIFLGDYYYSYADFTIGTAAPEPAALSLLACGILLLLPFGIRREERHQKNAAARPTLALKTSSPP